MRAKAVRNMQYLDSAAAYSTVPLAVSLDLCSVVRGDGIQYRAGFHQARQLPTPPFALFALLLTHIHDLPNF